MHTEDKELIELAAKAVKLPECGRMGPAFMYVKDNTFTDWNPLNDSSDAFGLAVKLKIDVDHYDDYVKVWLTDADYNVCEDYLPDPYAATRKAITRAAEIGRNMK